jgi:hypothetical protein
MLKAIDIFGVEFPFRVSGYQKFKTKTGGTFFLIYLICILFYFIYGIYDYFYYGKYTTIYWEENFLNNEVNLKDQEFLFAVLDLGGYIKNDTFKIESFYVNQNVQNAIKKKNCEKEEFNFDKDINYLNKNLYCFDHKINETITTDIYKRKEIRLKISPGKNFTVFKNYQIRIVNPISLFEGNQVEKYLGMNQILLSPDTRFVVQYYLEKQIYINDDDIILGNNKTKVVTNLKWFSIVNFARNKTDEKDPYFELIFKQTDKVIVEYTIIVRIHTVLLQMISMATTLLSNVKAIVFVLNLDKSKQNIFQEIFHINNFKKEKEDKDLKIPKDIEIKIIPKKSELKENSERINLRQYVNELFPNSNNYVSKDIYSKEDDNQNKKRESMQDILMKKKKVRDKWSSSKMQINNNKELFNNDIENNGDRINKNIIDEDNKLIKEKMINIHEKYPTIRGKIDYRGDKRFVRNIFSYIYLYLTCNRKRINEVKRLKAIIDKEFSISLNIYSQIKKTKKLEIIENLVFNKNEKILLDYISLPILNVDKDIDKKEIGNPDISYHLESIFNKYIEINGKKKKKDIEYKIIQFFRNKIDEIEK